MSGKKKKDIGVCMLIVTVTLNFHIYSCLIAKEWKKVYMQCQREIRDWVLENKRKSE